MNSSINISEELCIMPKLFWTTTDVAFWLAYYIIMPIYFFGGLIGHILTLWALCRRARSEGAYLYQISFTIGQIIDAFVTAAYLTPTAVCGLIGADRQNAACHQMSKCFSCMWYKAYLSSAVPNAVSTILLLISLCTAIDRFIALKKPFEYRLWNHRRLQMLAFVFCVFLGVSTSVFDCFRRKLLSDYDHDHDDHGESNGTIIYRIAYSETFMNNQSAQALNYLRTIIRMIALSLLIACNGAMIYYYRNRISKISHTMSDDHQQKQANQAPRNAQRKDDEKTLIILTIYQSTSVAITMSLSNLYYLLVYVSKSFKTCGSLLMAPLLDAVCELATGLDFFVLLIVSKRFRAMILALKPCH